MDEPGVPTSVRIGGLDRRELLQALLECGVRLNAAAEALFGDERFTPERRPRVVEIACLSVADLGLAEGATYDRLAARALAAGLGPCPLELGPHLRLQFLDQAEGAVGPPATRHRAPPGSVTVASVPLDDRDETPKGFYLRCIEGVPWLRGYWARPDNVWHPEDLLVFARDRSAHGAGGPAARPGR